MLFFFPIKHPKNDTGINMNVEWKKLIEELFEAHRTALKALYEKHQEEVKTMALNPNTVIPGDYFNRDVKAAISQLAMEILTAYQQLPSDKSQVLIIQQQKSSLILK